MTVTTFNQRITISGMIINGDVKRFNLNLDDNNTIHYLLLSLSLIISLLVNIGRLVEAHNQVLQSFIAIEAYFIFRIWINLLWYARLK